MSENPQFVDNPLHLTDIFSGGVFYFPEDEKGAIELNIKDVSQNENPPIEEEMIQLSIVNVFFDPCDAQFSADVDLAYHKLMSAVRINQELVIPEDVEKVYAIGEAAYNSAVLGDFLSPVIFVWSDREVGDIPAMYSVKPTEKGVMIRFPSFTGMCQSKEQKVQVWQTIQRVLKFGK